MEAYPQPTDDDVKAFLLLVSDMDRSEVIARLKGNNNNVQQALGEYFDAQNDPDAATKYRWDDRQFSSDRDGAFDNHGRSFNIQGADDLGPYGGHYDGSPTRPPSRTSHNKSPLSKVIDLTAQAAAADPRTSVTYDDDREFQAAIEASRLEHGLPPQESGITSTDEVHFGPANRPLYEQSKWDMVPIGKASAHEILLDPEPAERKRDLNVPAFLKPSTGNHRLGALITIYHEIPLLREIFLSRLDTLPNYGHDKEWWSGNTIELPAITGNEPSVNKDVLRELQRLMAFLDKTDRSYGSAEALANLKALKEYLGRSMDLESAVCFAWAEIFRENNMEKVKKLFSTGQKPSAIEKVQEQEFAILDLGLPSKSSLQETIYDVADSVLWPDPQTLELSESAYLPHIAEVIAFRLEGDEPKKGIDVPAVWYPDRYLESGRQASLEMRLQKQDIDVELRRIHIQEQILTECNIRGKTYKVKDLFKASLQHDQAEMKDGVQTCDDADAKIVSTDRSGKTTNLSTELRKVVESIDKKLLALNEQKEKARDALRELSKLYTEPSKTPAEPPLHRYTLRGVTTTKSTIYLCRRAEPDLIDMDLDGDASKGKGDQWWRIQYATSGSNSVTAEKTTEENVLQILKTENQFALLVYASDKAMEWQSQPLPIALETFVRNDNLLFKAEFPVVDSPKSPGKRKFDDQSENSTESQDQIRWDGGSSPKKQAENVNVPERERFDDSDWDGARTATQSLATRLTDGPATSNDNNGHEVIVGVDPSLLDTRNNPSHGQEMQERNSMRMLSSRTNGEKMSTIDSMDLDQVMEDDNTREESVAVKNVFTE